MALASNLDDAKTDHYMRRIFEHTIVTVGQHAYDLTDQVQFDECFSGRLPVVYKAAAFALEVNFRDFFPGSKGANAAKAGPEKS
jgi:hypothetical protein